MLASIVFTGLTSARTLPITLDGGGTLLQRSCVASGGLINLRQIEGGSSHETERHCVGNRCYPGKR